MTLNKFQMQLKYHLTSEEPIQIFNKHYSVLAGRHSVSSTSSGLLSDSNAQFTLPHLAAVIQEHTQKSSSRMYQQKSSSTTDDDKGRNSSLHNDLDFPLADRDCFQSHMISFRQNPFVLRDDSEVSYEFKLSGETL